MPSQAQQTAPQTQSTPQKESEQPTPEHEQAGGNQQALQEAGLASGSSETDTSLFGPYAEMMLSVMPLATALPMALPCVRNPIVRDWILALAPEKIAAVLEQDQPLSRQLLEHVWPAGIGFEIGVFGDLGLNMGAGLQAARSAVNTDGTVLDERLDATFSARVDTSVGGGIQDAFDNGAQVGAGAALTIAAGVAARAYSPMPAHWWTLLGKTPLDVLREFLSGVRGPVQLQTGVAPGEAFEVEVTATAGPELSAGGETFCQSTIPSWLAEAIQPLIPSVDSLGSRTDLSQQVANLEALLGATGKLQTVERVSPAGLDWSLELQGTLSGMVAGGLGTALCREETSALQEVAKLAIGGASVVTVRAGIHADCGLVDKDAALADLQLSLGGVELASNSVWGTVEQTDTQSYPSFTALLATQAALPALQSRPGDSGPTCLADVLSSGATLAQTRATRVELDPAQLADVAPGIWGGVVAQLGLDRTHVGATATHAELALVGRVEVTQDALQTAADAGTMAPGPTAGNALEETAGALLAAATGDALPGWAAPWADTLEAIGPELWTQSQVKGWAGLGTGGGVSVGGGLKGSGSAGGTAKVLVEIPTTTEQHRQLADAAR